MRTRASRLAPEHVAALNSIQVEFYGKTRVIDAYKAYIKNLNTHIPAADPEQSAFFREQNDLLVELIHEVGVAANYSIDKKEIETLAYSPMGWANDEDAQRILRNHLIEVVTGTRAFPVAIHAAQIAGGVFPPPPNATHEPPPLRSR